MSTKARFWWGAFGAVLPEILRLYRIIHEAATGLPTFTWAYFIITGVFVAAAGVFSIAWKPENELKGAWVGASFPVIVAQMIASAPPLPGVKGP